ncbi:hypothetical protein Ddye_021069 [Dipteronia dyeriana]|uniref:Uncharacterized protein n=1 Tax=Dipteronia dyeriana TaxID=168575 RepID=A0AAD9U1Z9_9ROSI|nr:hypothetical protein Ddye_021069 [Dipteronia dyeriana]
MEKNNLIPRQKSVRKNGLDGRQGYAMSGRIETVKIDQKIRSMEKSKVNDRKLKSKSPNLIADHNCLSSPTTHISSLTRCYCLLIHTKKRNRLDTNRLNNLVYVQFNSRLMDKRKRGTNKNIDILLANDASNAQRWIVDDGDDEVEPGSGLDDGEMVDLEDDFQSDDEAVEENVEFESYDNVVFQLEEYVVKDESIEYQS